MIKIQNSPIESCTLKASALHEAGHIICCIERQCKVKYSSIIDSTKFTNGQFGNTQFYTTAYHTWVKEKTGYIDDFAVIAVGGSVIEGVEYINDNDYELFKKSGYKKKDLIKWFDITNDILNKSKIKSKLIIKELLVKQELNSEQMRKYYEIK
jgi:hypothetical protein